MVFYIVLFCVIAAIILKLNTSKWSNPGTIFLLYWGFIVLMSSLRLYNLRETSFDAYFMIFVGVIAYFIGGIIANKFKIVCGNLHAFKYYNINYTFLIIAEIIVILYSLYRLSSIIQLLMGGNSWWEIRLMATSGENGVGTLKGGTLSQIIYEFVVAPLAYLISPTIVADLFVGMRNKKTLILGIGAMLSFSLSTVSRAIWAFTIIYIVFTMILYRKNYQLTAKQKKIIKFSPILIVVLFLVINQLTKMRNSEADILQNAYTYISGALPLLSIHLDNTISNTRTYGMLTLFGFLHPVLFILNRIHIIPYTNTFYEVQNIKDYLEIFRNIGEGINMNAYSTLFYDFYIDFGMIGVFVFSLLFGYICMRSYVNFRNKPDMRNLVLYLVLLQFIIFSMARIYTIYATRALTIIWLIPMFKKYADYCNSK